MKPDSAITGVVITFNERANVDRTVSALANICREVLVVDSGSTDDTVARAHAHGARVLSNPFISHAAQWTFALEQVQAAPWVLALDADQAPDAQLAADLVRISREAPRTVAGVYLNRLTVFRGQPLRHGGLFPKWMLKMFRPEAVALDASDLFDLRFGVRGEVVHARGVLVEDNRKEDDIDFWITKHVRYASLLAQEEQRRRRAAATFVDPPSLLGTPDQRLLYLKSIWDRLPRYWRGVAYFAFRYLLRLGFLDGRRGFQFHLLQALWFRTLVDIHLDALELPAGAPEVKCGVREDDGPPAGRTTP